MKALDKIFYKRLERIRNELDGYIKNNFERKKCTSGGLMNSFIAAMAIYEDSDDEYFDEKDSCISCSQTVTTGIEKMLEKREESFSIMLLRLIDEKELKDSDVYKRANIDRRLFSKIRNSKEYVPSKKTAISFCLALQLPLDETKKLLKTAGYTLSASSTFDLIIRYLIENKEYNIHFANIVLHEYGEEMLSK